MQMLHPHRGSIQQYMEQLDDTDVWRPAACPQCQEQERLTAHGFYSRTIVDTDFDGVIRVRRYLCLACKRTVSLLPEWALPYVRFSISVIAQVLKARLMEKRMWKAAAATECTMPYQRGQHWVRRFERQAEPLSAALAALTAVVTASDFVPRVLAMLEKTGWIAAHRFLFSDLRMHLLGWPVSQIPDGRSVELVSAFGSGRSRTHITCMEAGGPSG